MCGVGDLGQMQVCLPTKVITSRRLSLTLAVSVALSLSLALFLFPNICVFLSCLLPEHAGIRDGNDVYQHVTLHIIYFLFSQYSNLSLLFS